MSDLTPWSAERFKRWRLDMGWSLSQAAHVLEVSKPTVIAWESGQHSIGDHTGQVCSTVELLRTLDDGPFFGNALETLRSHYASLLVRMAEADSLPGRGRPRKLDETDDGTEPVRVNTRKYYFVLEKRKHPTCEARVESYCRKPPSAELCPPDFYYGRIVEGRLGLFCSQAMMTREEAEEWLEENGPRGHYLVYYTSE